MSGVRRRPVSLAARIAYHAAALEALRQEQRAAFVLTIAGIVGSRAFSASELWAHAVQVSPALRALLLEQDITSARRLGKRLQLLQGRPIGGLRLERVGRDHLAGAIWIVIVDCPTDACAP